LRRDQDRENVVQSRQGVPYPEAANLKKHERDRRKLEDEQQRERQELAAQQLEQHRARIRAEQRA